MDKTQGHQPFYFKCFSRHISVNYLVPYCKNRLCCDDVKCMHSKVKDTQTLLAKADEVVER